MKRGLSRLSAHYSKLAAEFFAITAIVLALVAVHPQDVFAASNMKITSSNLSTLNGFPSKAYGSSSKLYYTYGAKLNTNGSKKINKDGYFRIQSLKGEIQCVDAVRALSNNFLSSGSWRKGSKVTTGGVSAGTVIATFNSSNRYSGHVAVLKGYIKNSSGKITGIEVWDQNWASPYDYMFRKHTLSTSGSSLSDADNYYVVQY